MSRNKVLSLLFNIGEKTCVGGAKSTKVVDPFENEGEYYCVNPLTSIDLDYKKKPYYFYTKARRADINVSKFRNFVFEIDELSLSDQIKVIEGSEIDFSAIVYSGGKSYHCLICLEDELGGVHTQNGIDGYKYVWNRIAARINKTSEGLGLGGGVVDQSCKNPSRFTRYPEFQVEGRKKQEIFKFNEKRVSKSEFESLLVLCPEVAEVNRSKALKVADVESVEEFFKTCSVGLKNNIMYPAWANADAGLYPEMLKIVLWAIDETNVDKELLESIFSTTVFKQFERVGYPREKWYTAIEDGFRFKG